ncbi:MAG: hypothetical protein E1N59_1566 [Puniceicoccaceae bacterium 5H]|nr:MAG: hypothetical protein E1N59_1566 [Puniceicoccaceae bacterium 5H]
MSFPVTQSGRSKLTAFLAPLLALMLAVPSALAQQQFQGWCARVKIEIAQELTTERVGFEATLEVTNNTGEDPITDFAAQLTFENPQTGEDASDLFFVQPPEIEHTNAVDGSGVIGPTKTAVVRWFIIPKPTAGGTDPSGIEYSVGCELSGKLAGVEIPAESMLVIPEVITVEPEALLDITYFQPRDVQGDDPFTPEVESPIPFTLGVMVTNNGYSTAEDVVIESEQPRIVENKQGLLLIARLLGARVMDEQVPDASLTVNLGDIPPGQSRKGAWDMITSLSGEFVEFKASYTHADELGGEETSIIESIDAHFIAHEVLNDEPGRDDILDFLADTDRDEQRLPDALYETNGNVLPVNHLDDAAIGDPLVGRTFTVDLSADTEGWGYLRLDDPGQARYGIESVVRSDGKELDPHNFWTNVRYDPNDNHKITYLNILDRVEIGSYSYTVVYEPPPDDDDPPVTTLRFSGDVTEAGQTYYITRDTQMYFTSEDVNAVSIRYKVNNGAFKPGLPFSFDEPGSYEIIYYAEDAAGNAETESYAQLIIPGSGPTVDSLAVDNDTLFLHGDALSVRPGSTRISLGIGASPTDVDAQVDIFSGVKAFPVINGQPVSPTAASDASLEVAGDYVDFYRYRVNGGSWSTEAAAADLIELTGLSGSVEVEVMARSAHGDYPDPSEAVSVVWNVAGSDTIELDGISSNLVQTQSLTVTVANQPHFRWKLDDGYLHAPLAQGETFTLEDLEPGEHTLHFQLANDASSEDIDGSYTFTVDPLYGSDLAPLPLVYNELHEAVQGSTLELDWDGSDGSGVLQTPGWYTVRLSLADPLGQQAVQTRLVRIDDLAGTQDYLAPASTGPANVTGRGSWAVWQARASGNWDVYARDFANGGSTLQLTSSPTDQRLPSTDGQYAVWQTRRENGNTDIQLVDLANPGSVTNVTHTLDTDEIRAVVDWPWVVYQARPLGNADAPWQLYAWNADTGTTTPVDATTADQEYPSLHEGRVVWQDARHPGSGEIYFADLRTGERRRLTDDLYGQYFPQIRGQNIVWQDNRNGQVELYVYPLLRGSARRLTDTPYNEAHPYVSGRFVVYEEDSLGANTANLRLLDIDSGVSATLTRSHQLNTFGATVGGEVVWQRQDDYADNTPELLRSPLPAVQVAERDYNAIPVTAALASSVSDAFALLEAWHTSAGVTEVTRFTQLSPTPETESVTWDDGAGAPAGTNFTLQAGDFLWVRFGSATALDLGERPDGPLDLPSGESVMSYANFPDEYSAYAFIDSLGEQKVNAVRMLDASTGLWRAVSIENGERVGADFRIPPVAVLLLDLEQPVTGWTTQP